MYNQVLTGQQLNQQYPEKVFVKLTNQLENHNGYQFQTGLNIDSIPFNPSGECQPGGIYFCLLEKIHIWLNYNDDQMIYARVVTIPDDALVWVEREKFKADRIILSERQKIVDLEQWKDPVFCLEAVKQDGLALQYVLEQTPELCLEAVKQHSWALQYVKEQTPQLCLEAVKQDGWALQFVKQQTPELCLEAVRRNGSALQYVLEQTPELCLEAVKQNCWALKLVEQQTPEVCLEAVRRDGYALQYVLEQTPELCLEAAKHYSWALHYVLKETL